MKVLLLQDVKKVGRKMEVKEVSDGYARNFLIARKLAVPAGEGAMKLKSETNHRENELVNKFQRLAERLNSEILEFKVKAGEKGEVFGSVTSEQISKVLAEKGYEDFEVLLEKPIKKSGDCEVPIKFGRGINGKAKIRVSPIVSPK